MPTTGSIPIIGPHGPLNGPQDGPPQPPTPPGSAGSHSRLPGILASVLASVAFAGLFSATQLFDGVTAYAAVGWRVLAAIPFLAIILTALRQWGELGRIFARIRRRPALALVLVLDGWLFGVQMFLFAWGPMNGQALATSMGYLLLPLVLVAVGVLLYREAFSRLRIAAILSAALGVTFALTTGANVSWTTAVVALGYPVYFVIRKRFELATPAALSLEMLSLTPIALAFVLQPADESAFNGHPGNWAVAALMGLLTAIGFTAYTLAQTGLPMSLLGLLSYLEPVLLVIVSITILHEAVTIADLVSYSAITLAIILTTLEGLPRRPLRPAPPGASPPAE